MPDRFRTFALSPANTGANTLFTVPVADVAATPPVPVTTFMVKTIVLHNDSGSGTLNAVLTYNNGSTDFDINNVAVQHQDTKKDIRGRGRQANFKIESNTAAGNFKMGTFTIDVFPDGQR